MHSFLWIFLAFLGNLNLALGSAAEDPDFLVIENATGESRWGCCQLSVTQKVPSKNSEPEFFFQDFFVNAGKSKTYPLSRFSRPGGSDIRSQPYQINSDIRLYYTLDQRPFHPEHPPGFPYATLDLSTKSPFQKIHVVITDAGLAFAPSEAPAGSSSELDSTSGDS